MNFQVPVNPAVWNGQSGLIGTQTASVFLHVLVYVVAAGRIVNPATPKASFERNERRVVI